MRRSDAGRTAAPARGRARPVSAGPTRDAAAAQRKLSPARWAAFELLMLVARGTAHSDELLHGARVAELSEADRNLATALVMGVLRWQIALDARLAPRLARPDQALPEEVAIALRLGLFQLEHMDRIPPHAALSESVELCRAAGHGHAAGMVNAILRQLQREPKPGRRIFESAGAIAERLAHPAWLVERWITHFGRDAALAICEADQREAAAGGLFLPEAGIPAIDDGSRLVAELAAAALPAVEGRRARVWDPCAAPGGKTLVLAARLVAEGESAADLLATDVSARRMRFTEARLRAGGVLPRTRTHVADATALPAEEGLFDLVLCDVPCSGTGTLGRNPEIRLRLAPEDLDRQADRQRAILRAALGRLAPGGRLLYSTCSLEPEENDAVVAASLGSGVRIIPLDGLLARLPGLVGDWSALLRGGSLRTLPGVHPCDGFFACLLERFA